MIYTINLNAYRRNGVKEYLVWRVYDNAFDWFVLERADYRKLEPNEKGILESQTFIGLSLDVQALLARNLGKVIEVLQSNLNTEQHKDFIARLTQVSKESNTDSD